MKHKFTSPCAARRKVQYPELADQLDALWKLVATLREQGFSLPPDTADMLAQIQLVKTQFPKPGAASS